MTGEAEFSFHDPSRTLFTIKPLEDGRVTVELSPDVEWDEAGHFFWNTVRSLAEGHNGRLLGKMP